jgi:hypothetical protein
VYIETATKYNEFQKMYRKDASPLLDAALPELRRMKSLVEVLWSGNLCKGCSYIRKDEAFCNENCRKLARVKQLREDYHKLGEHPEKD